MWTRLLRFFKPKTIYVKEQQEWTAEDEGNIREWLDTPWYTSMKKRLQNRIADLNGRACSQRITHFIDRMEEVNDILIDFENMKLEPEEKNPEEKRSLLSNLIP